MKTLMLTFVILLSLSAHAEDPPPPNDIGIKVDLSDPPVTGRAYDSRSQNFMGTCVRGTGGTQNLNFMGSLSARLDSSQDDAASSLGIQAGGRYRTGVTEVSASAQLAQSSIKTGYSVNFTYKFDTSYSEQFLLDGTHQMEVAPGFKNLLSNPRGFFKSCGDEYVSSVNRAARLLVNLNVSFSSEEEANSFAASFALNSPTVGVTAAIQNAAKSVSKKTTMKFYSVQVGGTPGLSGKAICSGDIKGQGKSSNACAEPIIQCGFGKFDQCIELLEGIVNYSANNFAAQVTQEDGSPKNFAIVNVHAQPYAYAGDQFPLPPDKAAEQTFQEELKILNNQFESFFNTWVLANKMTFSGAPRLSQRQAAKMIKIEGGLHKIVNGLVIKIEDCYKYGYDKCHENSAAVAEDVKKALDEMRTSAGSELADVQQASDLNPIITQLAQPETLAQYCDLATDNNVPIKITIESLKKWAMAREAKAKSGKTFDTGDECANYDAYFKNITDLSLTNDGSEELNLPVSSLAPLTTLTALKSLNLSGQTLKDISDLKALTQLTALNLDRNVIEDVCPLASLPNLQSLSVQNNHISQLDCLKAAAKMTALDGRGNSSGLTCPLSNGAYCKLQDFSKSVVVSERSENCGVHVGSQAIALDEHRVLVVGGTTPAYGLEAVAAIDIYDRNGCDPSGGELKIARTGHTLTRLQSGDLLVAGGYTDTLEIINGKNFKSRLLNVRLSGPRSFHTATLLKDGRVLFVGGYMDTITLNLRSKNIAASFEIFNPATEKIEARGNLSVPRAEHTATLLADGRVLIVGGYQSQRNLSSAEAIDPVSGTVTTLSQRLNDGRFAHTAVSLNDGRVLIVGGMSWIAKSNDKGEVNWDLIGEKSLEIFDPKAQSFTKINDQLSTGRGLIGASVQHDGRVLLFGGNTAGNLFDSYAAYNNERRDGILKTASSVIELFDPLNQGVFTVGSLSQSRSQFAFAPLGANSLLVIGGMGSDYSLQSAELLVYKP